MLYLKNVRKEKDRLHADYYPEDWGEFGSVSVKLNDLNDYILNLSEKDQVEYAAYPYAINALNALRDMVRGKREIKDCLVMWY